MPTAHLPTDFATVRASRSENTYGPLTRQQKVVTYVLALTIVDDGAKETGLRDDSVNGSVAVREEHPCEFGSRFVDDVRPLGC